jgi:excisionase family DNA binding protein
MEQELSADLLWGAAAIAKYLGLPRRAVYHLAANQNIPHFRAGDAIAARKSELAAWASSARAAA